MPNNFKTLLIIYVSIFALVFLATCFSQTIEKGFSLAVNSTTLNYDKTLDIWSLKNRTLFSVFIFIEYQLSPAFSLKPALRFVRVGNRVEISLPLVDKFKITQDYLAVPLLLKFNPSILKNPRIYLLAGPEIGYLLSATGEIDNVVSSDTKESIYEDMKKFNFSAVAGVGLDFMILSQSFLIEFYYAHGLIETSDKSAWLYNWKTQEYGLSLGLKF